MCWHFESTNPRQAALRPSVQDRARPGMASLHSPLRPYNFIQHTATHKMLRHLRMTVRVFTRVFSLAILHSE
jgi:hypothetical protein